MVENPSHRLPKQERVCSKKLIDRLFNGGHSHTMSAFPLRVVYMTMTEMPHYLPRNCSLVCLRNISNEP